MRKIYSAFILALVLLLPAAARADSEEVIISVVEQALITYHRGLGDSVEYGGMVLPGKPANEALKELEEYVSNSWGYLDRLKKEMAKEGGKERRKGVRYRLKKLEVLSVNVDMNSAVVDADIYLERVSGNAPAEPRGGARHSINLEFVDNVWKIIWDYDQTRQ